jgi:Tol biopolymer transport system component
MNRRILFSAWFLLIVFLLSTAGCVISGTTISTSPSTSPQGKIAFISNRDGGYYIYLMSPDGSNQTQLTSGQRIDEDVSWSPDGKKLAIASSKEKTSEDIYVINADGSGEIRLTDNPRGDAEPSWSPDGEKIIFISSRDSAANQYISEIYVMNADGSNQTRLTYLNGQCLFPHLSPDSSKILFTFTSSTPGSRTKGIYIMKADGTDVVSLINNEESENFNAQFSPDGTKIVFASTYFIESEGRPKTLEGVNVMNADGSNTNRLTNGSYPFWSPDGKKIIFNSPLINNTMQIYVMDRDGSNQIKLTDNPSANLKPVWSR